MAISAYIFIETTQGKARGITREILQIPGVQSAHSVTGPYDVVTYVEADSISVLGDFIVTKIQAGETGGYYPLGFDTGVKLQTPLQNVDPEVAAKVEEIITKVMDGTIVVVKDSTEVTTK